MNPMNSFHRNLVVTAAAFFLIALSQPAAAQDDPTQARLTAIDGCGPGTYILSIDGSVIGTGAQQGACSCASAPYTAISVNDPATLALITSAPGCAPISVSHTGTFYITALLVDIDRPSGTESVCVVGDCSATQLCPGHVYGKNRTFVAAPSDTDGDGISDCSDPDSDNDGVLDGADNCPSTSNPLQEDTDGNGTGDACQANVVAVPWAGQPSKPHVVFNGGSIPLQASAGLGVTGEPVALVSGTWDPGDGSGPQAINVSNSRALELVHTYNGSPGQPFTAIVEVEDASGNTYSDTFKVQVQSKTLDVEVNMAIDKGLWSLHKEMTLGNSGGFSTGNWATSNVIAATAASVQAFEINGHREIGDPLEDPYVDNAARGLRYLQNHIRRVNIANQAAGNPDTNGNGYGLEEAGNEVVYIGGQIVDAFVASGTRNAVADIGSEAGRTYSDIVQDLMDAYSWGQHEDNQGGWVYRWNSQGGIDASSSQWWAVGAHAADVWDTNFTPQWVRDENWNKGIESLQRRHVEAAIPWVTYQGQFGSTPGTGTHGACSYRGGGGDHNHARTASCLVMMSADGIGRDNARFQAAEGYERRNFTTGDLHGNLYPMFALTKAMRLAKNAAGESEPIELLGGDLDWYRADPSPATPTNRNNGFARYLVGTQTADGKFNSSSWVSGHLSTAFGVIILSPTLFELAPIAACSADPLIDGTASLGGLTTFDGGGSSHQDTDYTGGLTYDWDFKDGNVGSGVSVNHEFVNVGIYNVTLTVTDDGGLSNTTSCPVDVRDNDIPPNANIVITADLPICEGDTFTLDGSTSVDLDNDIVAWEWDISAPVNFAAIDLTGEVVSVNFATAGNYDIGLRVTDNDGSNGGVDHTDAQFTSVTVLAIDNPSCNQPPVAVDDDYTADEDTLLTVVVPGVLTNDSDPDGDALTVALDTDVSNGTLTLNPDGSFTYMPDLNFNGSDSFTYHNNDGELDSTIVTVTITIDPVNDNPDVSDVLPTIACLWPPNHKFVPVGLVGGTDVDGDSVTLTVTGVRSDEPTKTAKGVGGQDKAPDATGVGTDTANLRVERMGKADGRVYTIQFDATDGNGGSTPGSATVGVPHDQSDDVCGIITGDYDATVEN